MELHHLYVQAGVATSFASLMLHSSELPRFKNFAGSALLSMAVGWFLWPLPLLAMLVNRGKIAMPPRWLTLAIVTPVAVLYLWWLTPIVLNSLTK